MADSFNKKEREKRRRKRKQEKAERKKLNKEEGKEVIEFMYVDENGNLTATPPDPTAKRKIKLEEIEISTPKKAKLEAMSNVRDGIVKFFNHEKGFGFIKEASAAEDYFVHIDSLHEPVTEGDKVTFEIGSGPKGLIALNVKMYQEPKVEEAPVEEPEETEAADAEATETQSEEETA